MKRKAQIFDIIPIIVICVMGIAALFMFYILFNSLTGTGIAEMEEFIQEGLWFVKGLDLLIPTTIISAIILSIFLIAPLRQIDGAWVIVLLLGIFVMVIVAPFGNAAEEFISSAEIAPYTVAFPFTSFIATKLPLLIGLWIGLLVMFSANKSSGGTGFYG